MSIFRKSYNFTDNDNLGIWKEKLTELIKILCSEIEVILCLTDIDIECRIALLRFHILLKEWGGEKCELSEYDREIIQKDSTLISSLSKLEKLDFLSEKKIYLEKYSLYTRLFRYINEKYKLEETSSEEISIYIMSRLYPPTGLELEGKGLCNSLLEIYDQCFTNTTSTKARSASVKRLYRYAFENVANEVSSNRLSLINSIGCLLITRSRSTQVCSQEIGEKLHRIYNDLFKHLTVGVPYV